MTTVTDFHAPAWRIAREFRYAGVIHSMGEPVPEMSAEEALEHERQGYIARLDADPKARIMPVAPMLGEMTPELYLAGPDVRVWRNIRVHRPSRKMLRAIAKLATDTTRSIALIEGLKAFLGAPLEEHERHQ